MKLIELLETWMEKKRLSKQKTAYLIGIDYTTFWRFMKGREINSKTYSRIITWVMQ